MRLLRIVPRGFPLALLLPLAACSSDPLSPAVNGQYSLVRLNDAALPYDHGGLGCCVYLSGSITLDNGTYIISVTAQNRNTLLVFTESEWGTYTQDGASLRFTPVGHSANGYFGLSTGTVSEDSVGLSFGGEGPGSADQFHAVFARSPASLVAP